MQVTTRFATPENPDRHAVELEVDAGIFDG